MRIIQMLPVLSFGDAIGNHCIALSRTLTQNGYTNKIYAEAIDRRLGENVAEQIESYVEQEGDIILYHMSTGSALNRKVLEYGCKKLINYHNITPAHFFHGYLERAEQACIEAREDLAYMAGKVDGCISDSAYNQQELADLGYQCPMAAIPILIAFDDYTKQPDMEFVQKYQDGYTNIIFVGRVVPNKKQEDLIEAFYYYKKYYNAKSRLILVGSFAGADAYAGALQHYADYLDAEDVILTGQISFPRILAFYKIADVFLCMSEHEGFCVPLVEAMYFKVPIIAYDSTAIGDTMGGAGILLPEKKPVETAGVIDYLCKNKELGETLRKNGEERLKDFSHEKVAAAYLEFLRRFM